MSSPSAHDFRNRQQESVWHSLNRFLVALIVFAVCILILCAFVPLLKRQRELKAQITDLRADIDVKKTALHKANQQEQLLRNDPEYLELVVRDRFDLMKEGETIFRLDAAPEPSEPPRMRLRK